MFAQRRNALAFWFGCAMVTLGVFLHLPMYWMARDMGFSLPACRWAPGALGHGADRLWHRFRSLRLAA